MSELNQNHPVTQAMRDQWFKLAAIMVAKAGGHAVITAEDIASFPPGAAITIRELADGIHLRVVDADTAATMARFEGGLPI